MKSPFHHTIPITLWFSCSNIVITFKTLQADTGITSKNTRQRKYKVKLSRVLKCFRYPQPDNHFTLREQFYGDLTSPASNNATHLGLNVSTRQFCPTLIEFGFYRQIFVKLSSITEIRPVWAALIHAATRTDWHDESNTRFLRLSESA